MGPLLGSPLCALCALWCAGQMGRMRQAGQKAKGMGVCLPAATGPRYRMGSHPEIFQHYV
jgi:hypothetical protein